MLHICTANNRHLYQTELREMHSHRYELFVRTRGWNLTVRDGASTTKAMMIAPSIFSRWTRLAAASEAFACVLTQPRFRPADACPYEEIIIRSYSADDEGRLDGAVASYGVVWMTGLRQIPHGRQ